jgi:hypothetical protein
VYYITGNPTASDHCKLRPIKLLSPALMKFPSRLLSITFATATLFSISEANAQIVPAKAFYLSLAINTGLPTSPASEGTTFILGGDISLQYGLTNKCVVSFITGGYHFFPKQNIAPLTRESYGIGPIKAGVKYFVKPNIYLSGETGAAYEVTEHGFSGEPPKLILAPGIGYAKKQWDVGLRYESYSGQNYNYGWFAVRVAYGLRLSK